MTVGVGGECGVGFNDEGEVVISGVWAQRDIMLAAGFKMALL